jgi:hypothetical protein
MRPIVIETPYAGDVERHLIYLGFCMLDCLRRGETPYASHGLLTRILDDNNPKERALGIQAGIDMAEFIGRAAFYLDLGFSPGMSTARKHYDDLPKFVWEPRTLPADLLEQFLAKAPGKLVRT